MKKVISILQLLAVVLMLAAPQQAKAASDEVIQSKMNYTVIPKGNGVYSFKVPVYVGAKLGNTWAWQEGGESRKSTVNVVVNGKTYELIQYQAYNIPNDDYDIRHPYIQFRADRKNENLGLFTFRNYDNTTVSYTTTGSSEWEKVQRPFEWDITHEWHTIYLEFEWKANYEIFAGKTLTFTVNGWYSRWNSQQNVKFELNSYTYNSSLMPPTIAGAFLNPDVAAGAEGQVKVIGVSPTTPQSVQLYVNDKLFKSGLTTNDNSLECLLDPCDTTRIVQIACIYNDEGVTTKLTSSPFTVLPYHKIKDMSLLELHTNVPNISSGYKQLSWSMDTTTSNDMFESDYFVIERAYLPDLSDAEQIGSVALKDTISAGQYKFIDDSEASVFNTKGGSKTYYRVRRTSSVGLYSTANNIFSVADSVENQIAFLPRVSDVTLQKDRDFDYNRKVKVNVELSAGHYYKLERQNGASNRNFYAARWNNNANIMLYISENATITDSIELDTRELKIDTLRGVYNISKEYVLLDPGIDYRFHAKVVIPESESNYLKFASGDKKDEGLLSSIVSYTDVANIRNVTATQGTEYGFVRVNWEMPGNRIAKLSVLRRVKNQFNYITLEEIDPSSTYFEDRTAELGVEYEYGIKAGVQNTNWIAETISWNQSGYTPAYGWVSPVGKITGKVVTVQGSGIGGQEVIVYFGNNVVKSTKTNDDGTFTIDGLELVKNGITYTVQVPSQQLEFTYNGEKAGAMVNFSGKKSLQEDVKFVCTTVERFSGRVLFENSTVPVGGAMFRINGETVHDGNNLPIKTDNNGNFEFFVPRQQVTVQVYKPGHHFVNDGFIFNKDNDKEEKQFTPSSAYDGLTLYDQTKVLLRGRVIGGNTLAAMPLGQGLTQNNLGDSITLQIRLEGNNTANIVYLKDQPDKDTLVVYNEQTYNGKTVTRTRGDFFRKQIDIHVDNETGEYAMELFPTKYKITQAFAQGYASLFANGEVAQVLDLTDSVNVDSEEMKQATHSITYHSDVDVTYQQLLWGALEVPYLGAEKQKGVNMFGNEYTTTLAFVDADDKVKYMLGDPLFLTGERYFLRGTAHEDYYYNNVSTGTHFIEPIRNGVVRVENGLESSNPQTQEFELNDKGQFSLSFIADNNNFALTGEDALCRLSSSVLVNGFYYQSKPLSAYVTGQRDKAGNVFTSKNEDITLLDILRDPYGSTSYSYYGKGKQYEMSRNFSWSFETSLKVQIESGVSYNSIVGVIPGGQTLQATSTSGGHMFQTSFDVPAIAFDGVHNATYNFTSKEVIKTSDNPLDVGAMADVYIGATSDLICQTKQVICVIDDTTYRAQEPNIKAGLIKVIQEGKDVNGNKRYLVVAEQLAPGYTVPSTFVYSQKHILTKVIPQLISERNNLLIGGEGITKDMVTELAKKQNKILYYYSKDDKAVAGVGEYGVDYEPCFPNDEAKKQFVDEIASYNKQILKWVDMISFNEELKYKTMTAFSGDKNSYSLSAGQNVSYSEDIAYSNYSSLFRAKVLGFNLSSGNNMGNLANAATKFADILTNDKYKGKDVVDQKSALSEKEKKEFIDSFKNLLFNDANKQKINENQLVTPTSTFKINIRPNFAVDYSDEKPMSKLTTYESGYEMVVNDDSYMNVSVYKTLAKTLKEFSDFETAYNYIIDDEEQRSESELLHQYVFVVNGGATRNPWCDADSTLFFKTGTPLGTRTQKIDNPVMKINTPEISNIPDDEKAIFTIKLTNDSELTGNQTTDHDSDFILKLVDESNEKGAKISIDGMPLTDGRTFTIAPGESINKTVEVLRGDGYDFDNIQLEFACKDDPRNSSVATFSVHYLPSSSPVKISAPTDKWVMNTFSAKDSIGYYMPIVVEGYNVGYKNFDHIEIQYKKSTEGDANWVNLCSYYIDDDLYEAASGTKSKEQIGTGKITHAFYGEKDPIEMKYDIRAVTFCRLGTGFVTKASNVISGMKDTRRPTVFGKSQPLNGILTNENTIMLPFSEQIAYNYLDETSNFEVLGYVSSDDIDENVGLVFTGDPEQDAYTSVSRNLSNRDFTIDMLVQPDEDMKEMTFFSHGDKSDGNNFVFGITDKRQLFVNYNGQVVKSVPLAEPVNQAMTHVGVEFNKLQDEDMDSKGALRFFVGNSFIDTEYAFNSSVFDAYSGNSQIHFGVCKESNVVTAPFKGRMLEVRLWNQAIDLDMISEYNKKQLDGYSNRIIGYWPMRQSNGDAKDEANGADLTLEKVNWHTETGHSLIINNKSFELDGASFQRSANFDYTLAFWMNIKEAKDKAMLFSAGSDAISEKGKGKLRIGFEEGELVLRSNGNTTTIVDADEIDEIVDSEWHHFALSVSHSKNIANIYIDGDLMEQIQGDKVDGISMEDVRLGSDSLKANIDLLTFWHKALPQDYLKNIMNYRLNGNEMGLYVYLPFDESKESTQGTITNRFTVTNQAKDNMDIYHKTMIVNVDEQIDVDNVNNAPVLNNLPLTKLKYSWSSDGTNLLINLDMKDSEINHHNVLLTVRDVEDLNGNTMANPYSWVIYADRNILRWETDTKNIKMKQNEVVEGEVTWKNITSASTNYMIVPSSPYIKVKETMGVAAPDHTNYLNFTIDKGITPGNYEEYIWLIDDDNDMVSTLTLNISVQAEEPDWAVDRSKFDQTMSVIATVQKKTGNFTIQDNDTRDKVGVFAGSECVGVANISDNKDLARIYLNVYGNSNNAGKTLSFFLWDYSEGTISQLTPSFEVKFKADSIAGTPKEPLVLTSSKSMMQEISLDEGWNWIALNVKPFDASSLKAVFLNSRTFSNGDIIKDDSKHAEYSASNNRWIGDAIQFTHEKVYHVYANNATRISIVGTELSREECVMNIKQGWNQLPYLLDFSQPITHAMADFQVNDKASEGDIIKGIDSFAVLSEDYGWIGSLETLEPGNGYYLYHTGKETSFEFNENRTSSSDNIYNPSAKARRVQSADNNMIVIAAIAEDETLPANAIVRAYSGDDCIGEVSPITLPDGTTRYFVTVPETEQSVQFVVDNADSEPQTVGALPYNGATCIGTIESPYILSGKNLISDSDALYDLSGRRVNSNTPAHGIYVKKGMKIAK